MIFLTKYDLDKQIKADILERIIEQNDAILHEAELASIAEMTSYLKIRYDTAQIFNRTGYDRNALVVMYLIDIILYHTHSRLNPRQVPDIRQDRYDQAMAWLKMVAKGDLNPDLPEITDKPNTKVRYSKHTKIAW